MCPDIDPFLTFKLIGSIAAPTITIFSALLGLFTQTSKEKTVYKGHDKIKIRQLTKWAWWSLGGILFGGTLSILTALNELKISAIEACKKEEKDRVYSAKMDSLNHQLIHSRDTLRDILNASGQTIKLLDDSYASQLVSIEKENALVDKSEQALHPLMPLKVTIDFQIQLPPAIRAQFTAKLAAAMQSDYRRPKFLGIENPYSATKEYQVTCNSHSLIDTTGFSPNNDYFIFLDWVNQQILPEIYEIAFFRTKNCTRFDNDQYVYDFFGWYLSLEGFPLQPWGNAQLQDIFISFNYEAGGFISGRMVLKPFGPSQAGFNANFKSLYQIKNGSIGLNLKNYDLKYAPGNMALRLTRISLTCGGTDPESFATDILPADKIGKKDDPTFTFPIDRLLRNIQ